jgi:hypothetical protein
MSPTPVCAGGRTGPHKGHSVNRARENPVNRSYRHEELIAKDVAISYPALTAFCRRHGIGHAPKPPVGHYDFTMGQEMQHDTSPHRAPIGGVEHRVQTASLVLCYSRMLFVQLYPAFTRFTCKVFLTDALEYMAGACAPCMIDNTHVVVASGTGARMVVAPEMVAFAARFHFTFRAHEKGDANRSGRVERPFRFVETNVLAGRTFTDFADLNAQARAWCDKVNATHKDHLHASPRELFAAEWGHLQPLPLFIPEVYVAPSAPRRCRRLRQCAWAPLFGPLSLDRASARRPRNEMSTKPPTPDIRRPCYSRGQRAQLQTRRCRNRRH